MDVEAVILRRYNMDINKNKKKKIKTKRKQKIRKYINKDVI